MNQSIFNVTIQLSDGGIVYNTSTGKMIKLNPEEYSSWLRDDFSSFSDLDLKTLLSYGILKTHSADYEFENYVNSLNQNTVSEEAYYKVLTTTACNARCFYCFERNFPKLTMSPDMAEIVADFILKGASKYGKLRIDWFGGEPLINTEVIDHISNIINNSDNIDYSSGMITNGSLFNEKTIIKSITEWNLKNVQITLDGIGLEYDAIKNYKDESSFEKVIDNIHMLVDYKVKVTIRINYSNKNVDSVLKLIDYLYKEFKNNLHVYCSPIFDNNPSKPLDTSYETDELVYSKLLSYGYVNPILMLKVRSVGCGLAALPDHFVIGPDGRIYKCAESMLCPTSEIGNVIDGVTNTYNSKLWASRDVIEECKQCTLYPICLGGCKAYQLGITNIKCFRFRSQVEKAIIRLYEMSNNYNEPQV